MKRLILVLLLSLGFSSDLPAQRATRHVMTEQGSISGGGQTNEWEALRVRLESSSPNRPTMNPSQGDHFVPVSQLHIPAKALKEFERSQKAFRSGDAKSSTVHLRKALQIYPDFIDAHNALGLRFVQLGEYQKALDEHKTALAVDSHVAQTHQDLAVALFLLNRPQEAEAEAREAIDLDPQAPAPRYVLARALIGQRQVTREAIEMLRQTEDSIPNASLVLAQIYYQTGHPEEVVSELRRYLRAPVDLDNKQKAECWIAQLSREPLPKACPADVTRPSFH